MLGAITSTTWAFEQPVRQALIPQLVQREDLVNALALNAVVFSLEPGKYFSIVGAAPEKLDKAHDREMNELINSIAAAE